MQIKRKLKKTEIGWWEKIESAHSLMEGVN